MLGVGLVSNPETSF